MIDVLFQQVDPISGWIICRVDRLLNREDPNIVVKRHISIHNRKDLNITRQPSRPDSRNPIYDRTIFRVGRLLNRKDPNIAVNRHIPIQEF